MSGIFRIFKLIGRLEASINTLPCHATEMMGNALRAPLALVKFAYCLLCLVAFARNSQTLPPLSDL